MRYKPENFDLQSDEFIPVDEFVEKEERMRQVAKIAKEVEEEN